MLRCTMRYRALYVDSDGQRLLSYEAGEIVNENAAVEAWLCADLPAAFEVVQTERALEDAPNDRMVTTETPATRRRARTS